MASQPGKGPPGVTHRSPEEETKVATKTKAVAILLCPNKEKWPGPVASSWWGTQEEVLPIPERSDFFPHRIPCSFLLS